MKLNPKIVCLGGGIGTVNLVKGLKKYSKRITVIVSMADDGGSAGRLRRLFGVPPPGDLISCLEALSESDPLFKKALLYRFRGDRYGRDDSIGGHKLGNLILVALSDAFGDFGKALKKMEVVFRCRGEILPSTKDNISIWAVTSKNKRVYGEENIDLGKFEGSIKQVYLNPPRPKTTPEVTDSIIKADVIVTGPGDLYTTVLPVLLVPDIKKAIYRSQAKKIFIVNVANKPFEAQGYRVSDYLRAIVFHLGQNPFNHLLVNINKKVAIPSKFRRYQYVNLDKENLKQYNLSVEKGDYVDTSLPLYHDSDKLAKAVTSLI